jgi:hypothetical protein
MARSQRNPVGVLSGLRWLVEPMTNLLLRLLRPALVAIIVEAMREHDQEVTRRLNAELRKPTRPARH